MRSTGTIYRCSLHCEENLAKDTIRLILANLGCALNHARDAGLIRDNPAVRLTKFYKQTKRIHDKIQPPTAEETGFFYKRYLKEKNVAFMSPTNC